MEKLKEISQLIWRNEFENQDESILKTVLAFSDYYDFNAKTELIFFRPNTPPKYKPFQGNIGEKKSRL